MKTITTFLITILLFGILLLALPEKGIAGLGIVPPCPCDTATLSNGLTGNEIIEIVCPDGNLGADSSFEEITEDGTTTCNVSLDNPPKTTYLITENNIGSKFCVINTDGVLPTTLPISDDEYELCRKRLFSGCNLPPRNVPTLSEWGLIAMAGILGIVGFIVMRRRKVTA